MYLSLQKQTADRKVAELEAELQNVTSTARESRKTLAELKDGREELMTQCAALSRLHNTAVAKHAATLEDLLQTSRRLALVESHTHTHTHTHTQTHTHESRESKSKVRVGDLWVVAILYQRTQICSGREACTRGKSKINVKSVSCVCGCEWFVGGGNTLHALTTLSIFFLSVKLALVESRKSK